MSLQVLSIREPASREQYITPWCLFGIPRDQIIPSPFPLRSSFPSLHLLPQRLAPLLSPPPHWLAARQTDPKGPVLIRIEKETHAPSDSRLYWRSR